jgi:hypothetical protein
LRLLRLFAANSSSESNLAAAARSDIRSVMPTATLPSTKRPLRKSRARAKARAMGKGPSFGEWARRVAGIVKSGERDLSTREGFGD